MSIENSLNEQIEALIQQGNQSLMNGENWKARNLYLQCQEIYTSHKKDIRPDLLAQVFYNIALSYSNMYQNEKAITYYNKCIGFCDENSEPLVYSNIGDLYDREDKTYQALEYFKQSLKLYKKSFPNSEERVRSEHKIADTYYRLGRYQDAIGHYQEYIELKDSLNLEHLSSIQVLYNLGLAYQTLNKIEKSIQCFEKSLQLIRKQENSDKSQKITILYQLAQNYQRNSSNEKAIKNLYQVLKLQDTDCQKSETYLRLGTIFHVMQKNKEAVKCFEKFLAFVYQENTAEFLTKISVVLNNMGNIQYKNGNHAQALAQYKKCLQIELKIYGSQSIQVANTRQNIGNCHFLKQDMCKAIDYYKQSFQVKSKLGCQNIQDTLKLLADAHYFKECLKTSLHYYQRYLQICQKKGKDNNEDIISTLTNIGNLQYRMNNTEEALQAYKLAKNKLSGEQNTLSLAPILCNMGNVYFENGQYQRALEEYKKSMEIYQEYNQDIAPNLINIGNVYQKMEKHSKAIEYWLKALEFHQTDEETDPSEKAEILLRIGEAYKAIGDKKKAIEYLKQHLKVSKLSDEHSFKQQRQILAQIRQLENEQFEPISPKFIFKSSTPKTQNKISRFSFRGHPQTNKQILLDILQK